jgi:glycosyltransferase involved in cell wall biosynthesis
LFNALLRYGSRGTLRLVKSSLLPRASLDLSPIPPPPRARKRATVDVVTPVGAPEPLPCAVWHDLTGAFKTLYDWRALGLTRQAPFTFASHGFHLAEQEPLHRLLQFDVRPWDSLICSTPSTRVVVEKLLDRARELARIAGSPRRLPFRLDVIPHGVDTDRFRPRAKAPVRKRLGLPASALILLSLGRISPAWKGDLLPLLAVYRSLVRERPDLPLLLVVAGYVRPDEKYYEALLHSYAAELKISPDRIKFVGPIDPQDSQLWYSASDIFVGVTHFDGENFGLTAVEAMAAGVPQIVTSWGGCRDTVVDGVTGFQIPTLSARCDTDLKPLLPLWRAVDGWLVAGQTVGLDTKVFRHRLQALVDNKDLRRRMAVESRRRAASLYDWNQVVRQYEALWNELIGQASRARRPRTAAPPRGLSVFDRISELASTELGMDAVVEISELGTSVLANEVNVPIYLEMESVFSVESLVQILKLLTSGGRARIGALVGTLSRRDGSSARYLRHVLFALKQGFIELCGDGT